MKVRASQQCGVSGLNTKVDVAREFRWLLDLFLVPSFHLGSLVENSTLKAIPQKQTLYISYLHGI